MGHSLGGTLVYAAIEALGNGVCASGVTLGSAMNATAKNGFIRFLLKVDPLVKRIPYIPLRRLAQCGAALTRWVAPLEDNFFYAIDNMDLKTLRTAMDVAVEDISSPLFLQLHRWYRDNHFCAEQRKFSYRDNLKKIRAPFLVCAGSVDGLTAYPDVHYAYEKIRSKKKKFMVFGRTRGHRTEYGHMDLILGKNAPREVFPVIADWLNQNDHH